MIVARAAATSCHAPRRPRMAARAALALLFALVSAPLPAGEPVFPGSTWEMPGQTLPDGWDPERLRAAEARFQATKPTAVMVVHDAASSRPGATSPAPSTSPRCARAC